MSRSTQLISPNASADIMDNAIIKLTFLRPKITLTKEEVMCGWQMAIDHDPERKSKILLVTAEDSLLDKGARKAAFEEKEKWHKVAMVIHNTGQVLMAKMSISKFTPSSNTMVFNNEKEALVWLNQEA